ncbi:unnamed protein product, partial [Cyprideis torosa]
MASFDLLENKSRKQLMELAQELNVPGRTKIAKTEGGRAGLIHLIREFREKKVLAPPKKIQVQDLAKKMNIQRVSGKSKDLLRCQIREKLNQNPDSVNEWNQNELLCFMKENELPFHHDEEEDRWRQRVKHFVSNSPLACRPRNRQPQEAEEGDAFQTGAGGHAKRSRRQQYGYTASIGGASLRRLYAIDPPQRSVDYHHELEGLRQTLTDVATEAFGDLKSMMFQLITQVSYKKWTPVDDVEEFFEQQQLWFDLPKEKIVSLRDIPPAIQSSLMHATERLEEYQHR